MIAISMFQASKMAIMDGQFMALTTLVDSINILVGKSVNADYWIWKQVVSGTA
jgi:hypothetical protein